MALEIVLRPPFSLPRMACSSNEEPQQEYHWVGHVSGSAPQRNDPGATDPGQKPKGKAGKQAHRSLSSITQRDAEHIARFYAPQLVRSPLDGWIARGHFCRVHLRKQIGAKRPPVLFGRVAACYPQESHVSNVQEFELFFPNRNTPPDLIQLHAGMINFQMEPAVESYCVRVRFLLTEEEEAEFLREGDLFLPNGFRPETQSGYLDILDMTEQNQGDRPWMYVVGSRWFTSLPESRVHEIAGRLQEMLHWGKTIINYHPDFLFARANTLNRVLKQTYGLSKYYLSEPGNPQDTAEVVRIQFEEKFSLGLFG